MTVEEALAFFENIPGIKRKLQTLHRRGAGLHPPGPARHHAFRRRGPAREAGQRAAEALRPGKTFYILDEPTTGLHFEDVRQLLDGAPAPGGRRQHGARDRAQPGRRQERRPHRRPGPRGRRAAAAPSSPRGRPKRSRRSPTATRGPSSSGCSRNIRDDSSARNVFTAGCGRATMRCGIFSRGIRRLQERGRKAWQKRWRRRLGDIWRVASACALAGGVCWGFSGTCAQLLMDGYGVPALWIGRARAWSSRRHASCS